MDILERISQVRKEDYEFTGNVEDAVFVFKGYKPLKNSFLQHQMSGLLF